MSGKHSGYLPSNTKISIYESTKGEVQVKAINLRDVKQMDSGEKEWEAILKHNERIKSNRGDTEPKST